MIRGEVWWVGFGRRAGSEVRKSRPAVIISNDTANEFLDRVQVVPLTSNVAKVYPAEALVTVRGEERKAMADQITTVSKARLGKRVGTLSWSDMQAVEEAVMLQLGLSRID